MIGGTSIGVDHGRRPGDGLDRRRRAGRGRVDAFQQPLRLHAPDHVDAPRRADHAEAASRCLGDVDIADLWIPYFCVSTNLTHAAAEYHDRGPLRARRPGEHRHPGRPPAGAPATATCWSTAVSSTTSRSTRCAAGTRPARCIAIDVAPVEGPVADRDYGLSVSGFRELFRRRARARPPSLVSTMVRSSLLASVRDRAAGRRATASPTSTSTSTWTAAGSLDFSTADEIADARRPTSTRPVLRAWFARRRRRRRRALRADRPDAAQRDRPRPPVRRRRGAAADPPRPAVPRRPLRRGRRRRLRRASRCCS